MDSNASVPAQDAPGDAEALAHWRAERRAELLAARQALPAVERAERLDALNAGLRAALSDVRGLTIAYYVPFRGEPDLRPLADEWRAAGARTALPVVLGRGVALEFRLWWPGAPVRKGTFSLPMPDGTELVTPDVVVMPPVGFDAHGFRLGYGGGYFDRTLAALDPAPVKVGVAYELSRLATIYPQPHDIPMDYVVTEVAVYRRTTSDLARMTRGERFAIPRAGYARDDRNDEVEPIECASPPCYASTFERDD